MLKSLKITIFLFLKLSHSTPSLTLATASRWLGNSVFILSCSWGEDSVWICWACSKTSKQTFSYSSSPRNLRRINRIAKRAIFKKSGFLIRIRCSCLDPDSVFKFLWIRIRFQPLDLGAKKKCRRGSKSCLLKN